MSESTFDNSYSGTLWPENDPENPGVAVDGMLRGNFIGPDNTGGLRLAAKRTEGGSWAIQVQRAPQGRERKTKVLYTGVLSKSNARNPNAPVLLGYIKATEDSSEDAGTTYAMAGFRKTHEFRGDYVQVVKSTIEQVPLTLSL
jgi:hypothetical protein